MIFFVFLGFCLTMKNADDKEEWEEERRGKRRRRKFEMGGQVEMVVGGDGDVEVEVEVDEMEIEDLRRIQPWTKQLTVRGLVASLLIGIMYSIIVMKLNLTTGLVPTLNVSAALLAFVFLRTWTKILHKAGFVSTPFTRQENTVVQTCAVACYSIAVGGGSCLI